MSRRFSMTSNPVRASESQDEAKPLLGDAEEKCDVVVEAIGFGNWSLLLVILLGFLFMGDSIEATLLSFLYDCVGGTRCRNQIFSGAAQRWPSQFDLQVAHSTSIRSRPQQSFPSCLRAKLWAPRLPARLLTSTGLRGNQPVRRVNSVER